MTSDMNLKAFCVDCVLLKRPGSQKPFQETCVAAEPHSCCHYMYVRLDSLGKMSDSCLGLLAGIRSAFFIDAVFLYG